MKVTIDQALLCLLHRIDAGEEFPDACFKVSVSCSVSYTALQTAYDLDCISPTKLPQTRLVAGFGWPTLSPVS